MKENLANLISNHLVKLKIKLPKEVIVEHPKNKAHGDFSTNVAMILAKQEKVPPAQLAKQLANSLATEHNYFEKVEIKGPGFINFFLKPKAFQQFLVSLWETPQKLALPNLGQGEKVLIEFVSANPTGPMHVGHGRNAVVGDCLARLLDKVGFEVTREFYVNDHGVQIQTLGRSGQHYHQSLFQIDEVKAALPDDMYRGAYLEELVNQNRDKLEAVKQDPLAVGKLLGTEILKIIQQDLKKVSVFFDHYFSESSLYEEGEISEALQALKSSGLTYEQEGAIWFKTTQFGDDKDRVLIKKDQSYTYFTPDIAYHKDKFERRYHHYINVMGADHGGYVPRLKAAISALGFDASQLEVLLMQMVSLKRGCQVVSMSKRSGEYVTLQEVVEEVGVDATRFFFMMRSHHSTLEFDLELAKKQTPENPVFYIQYAHARICSIFAKAIEAGYPAPEALEGVDLAALSLPEELAMIKAILDYPRVLVQAAQQRDTHRIAFYLLDLVKTFQNYYTKGKADERYRVITQDKASSLAQLFLLKTLRAVIALGLEILGVTAPEQMVKVEE